MFSGIKVIYCEEKKWVMVFSKNGISRHFEDMLKAHYNVSSVTIVLRDYSEEK